MCHWFSLLSNMYRRFSPIWTSRVNTKIFHFMFLIIFTCQSAGWMGKLLYRPFHSNGHSIKSNQIQIQYDDFLVPVKIFTGNEPNRKTKDCDIASTIQIQSFCHDFFFIELAKPFSYWFRLKGQQRLHLNEKEKHIKFYARLLRSIFTYTGRVLEDDATGDSPHKKKDDDNIMSNINWNQWTCRTIETALMTFRDWMELWFDSHASFIYFPFFLWGSNMTFT